MKSARLMSMLLLLQTHERMTSKELADRFEVSQRTVFRDVEALSATGVPIHTERGRGGAIVLDRRARMDPARLDPAELQLLRLAGLDSQQLESIGLQGVGVRAQEKLAAVAARRSEATSSPLSDVLLVDPTGWLAESQELDLAALLNAARDQRRVRLRYRRSGQITGQWLVADPYGLVSKAASWYLVADVDGQPRLFNTRRIEVHQPQADAAELRPGQDLRTVWAALLDDFQPTQVVEVHALIRSTRLDLARRILGTRLVKATAADSEWSSIVVHYPDVESVRQLLQFGDHIRVLSPVEAVERIHALAGQLAHHHEAGDSSSVPRRRS
ncbi:UNVERIFIED_CONTAM: WYL domain-containing protein [Kocuria sp. CPCC 205295]|uniref:HTH deoR-type domain-containing protein n=1 Tax=Kocuria palustris PEL TaxID=1236550 RepID=M2XCZ0_9MICC|nr:WYL domain-containing protein [Kocuria palustris]EME36901.1 hypothetical protein C884_02261 [Kocuria palustris PEL]